MVINIQISKKDVFLFTAILVFFIGAGFVIATGGTPNVNGHTADEIYLPGALCGLATWQQSNGLYSELSSCIGHKVYQDCPSGFSSFSAALSGGTQRIYSCAKN